MARESVLICDGCGARETIARKEGKGPPTFYSIKTTVGSFGTDVDVCPACHDRLLLNADPKRWPRVVEERR